VGKPEGRRPQERPIYKWEGNIKMDLREIGFKLWTVFIWLKIETNDGLL
jgi:hypothetical protein